MWSTDSLAKGARTTTDLLVVVVIGRHLGDLNTGLVLYINAPRKPNDAGEFILVSQAFKVSVKEQG